MTQQDIHLSSPDGNARATVAAKGANITSLRVDDEEYLWQGGAPWPKPGGYNVIFPTFGIITHDGRYTHGGATYTMPKHGFCRDKTFSVVSKASDKVTFSLSADEETKKSYPFDFNLTVAVQLARDGLSVDYALQNPDAKKDLVFSLGTHPAFRWPLPGAADASGHTIEFEQDENSSVHSPTTVLDPSTTCPSPVEGRTLKLDPSLFKKDALFWIEDPDNLNQTPQATRLHSASVKMMGPSNQSLAMHWHGFKNLGLWSKAATPEHKEPGFLCLEPFSGCTGGPTMHYKGTPPDIADIPHMIKLKPGDTYRAGYSLKIGA